MSLTNVGVYQDLFLKRFKQARRKAIQFNRFEILKADINDHLDIIKDNLTNMEGCFEILIPKNIFQDEDLDFDALLRGEASNNQSTSADTYKDVSRKRKCEVDSSTNITHIEHFVAWFGIKSISNYN